MEFYFKKPAPGETAALVLDAPAANALEAIWARLEGRLLPYEFYGHGWLYPIHLRELDKASKGIAALDGFARFLRQCMQEDMSLYYVGD